MIRVDYFHYLIVAGASTVRLPNSSPQFVTRLENVHLHFSLLMLSED